MLVVVLRIGEDHFAIEARCVLEVVPRVELRPLPHAPESVAGIATWRAKVVPVIDLVRLMLGQPCPARMSSRIVVVGYPDSGEQRPLGLLAEQITDVERLEPDSFVDTGVVVPDAKYLGRVAHDGTRLVQLVAVEQLLPAPLRAMLFAEANA